MTVPFTDDNFISLLQNPYVNYKGVADAVEVLNVAWRDKEYEADLIMLLPDESGGNTTTEQL